MHVTNIALAICWGNEWFSVLYTIRLLFRQKN